MSNLNGRRGFFYPTSQLVGKEGEYTVVKLIRWWRCSGKAPPITYSGSREARVDKPSISRPESVFLEYGIAVH